MAYHDPSCATPDAMRVGRLHTHMDGWTDANIAFMRSGGYSISSRIQEVQQPTLVLWGRQDEILEPKYAAQFEAALPNGRLQWVEDCGHCAHLEKPTEVCCKGGVTAIVNYGSSVKAPSISSIQGIRQLHTVSLPVVRESAYQPNQVREHEGQQCPTEFMRQPIITIH